MSEHQNFEPHDDDQAPREAAGDPRPEDAPAGDATDAGQTGPAPAEGDVDARFADIVEQADLDQKPTDEEAAPGREAELENALRERTEDLQRLQAEYVNYKRRVDRDRNLSRQAGVEKVVADLMPVMDSIHLARQHGELEGGFKHVADELERLADNHGLTSFGEVGEEFDPTLHEALMQMPLPGARVTSISQVMQLGYKLGDRVLRPARVAVSDPDPDAVDGSADQPGPGDTDQQH